MLIHTHSAPSLRADERLKAVFSHPHTSHLLDYPVWVPQALLDSWAFSSVDVANTLCRQVKPVQDPYELSKLSPLGVNAEIDCLSVDFAIVNGVSGLDIFLVELQSFPSLMHHSLVAESVYAPGGRLAGLSWDERRKILRDTVQQGFARPQVVMLDQSFAQQRSFMDFFAADTDVVPLGFADLYEKDGVWWYFRDGKSHPISAVYNRAIYETLPESERSMMRRLISSPSVTWLNHPANFFAYTKGALVNLQHPLNPQSIPAQWPLPNGSSISDWVLKPLHGHSGKGVLLHPTESQIRAGYSQGDMLQRKINYAQCVAIEGAPHPLRAEIRFMLLKNRDGGWAPIATLIRTSLDGNISQSMRLNRPGEGSTIACPQVMGQHP